MQAVGESPVTVSQPALPDGLPSRNSRGIYSSRRIERACEERVDFMALTGSEKPDHSTICQFRSDHLEAIKGLFVQVLALCRDAGMVKLAGTRTVAGS